MSFWKNLFDPVRSDDAFYDDVDVEDVKSSRASSWNSLPLKEKVRRLHDLISPDEPMKDTSADEMVALAAHLGVRYPTEAESVSQKVDFLANKVMGIKTSSKSGKRSIDGDVEKMGKELGVTFAPDDDTIKKMEKIADDLGEDKTKLSEMPLVKASAYLYDLVFGS